MNPFGWSLVLALALCGCASPRSTPPSPVRAGAVVVSSVYGGPDKNAPQKTFYKWELTGASDLEASFAGQTIHITPDSKPAVLMLSFSRGPSDGQVTADLNVSSGGSSSNASVNIGASERDLSKLIDYKPSQREIRADTTEPLAKGIGAFPSLYVKAKS